LGGSTRLVIDKVGDLFTMPDVSLPEIIGGKYRPRSVLGAGSTGTVYSVEHTLTGELLALKVMTSHLGGSEDAIARFKREALVVSKIRSQHVVRIFDADVAPELSGAPYLVMDLLEGIDLDQLSDDQQVEPPRVVEWLRQVAKPLDKAHRLGIIHRDLKPANLFLTRRDDGGPLIKILDFGIARVAAESMSVGTTQWGQLLGTPLYMAPEQARGDPTQVGPATDLYAMGLTAFKLLTSRSYRTGITLTEMIEEILHQPLRAPSEVGQDLGPEFDCWFLRACHLDPVKRFASAEEQVEALARALDLPQREAGIAPSSGPRELVRGPRGSQHFDSDGRPQIDSVRSTPGGGAPASSRSRLGGMGSAGLAMTKDSSRPSRNPWRWAFFSLATLVVLSLLGLLLTRRSAPGARAAIAEPLVCATGSAAALPVAPVPRPPESSIAVATPASAEAAKETSPAPKAEAQPARTLTRASPPRPAGPAPRPHGVVSDDPLSYQQ
jgi:serine/threonine-protein kinase